MKARPNDLDVHSWDLALRSSGLIPVSCSDATRTLDRCRVDAVVAGPLVNRAVPPRAARATWTLNAAKLACLRRAIPNS